MRIFMLGFVCCMLVAAFLTAQQRDPELHDLANAFASDISIPAEVYRSIAYTFAKEAATIQRERDAQLAESMGHKDVAERIREAKR